MGNSYCRIRDPESHANATAVYPTAKRHEHEHDHHDHHDHHNHHIQSTTEEEDKHEGKHEGKHEPSPNQGGQQNEENEAGLQDPYGKVDPDILSTYLFNTLESKATKAHEYSKSNAYQDEQASMAMANDEPPGRLVSSILISRHGDRSPQMTAPAFAAGNRLSYLARFPIDYSPWEVDYGQLTHIGFRQTYDLGSWLRKRYIMGDDRNRLLEDRYDHKQTHARSTDVDRTLVSTMGILAGLYPSGTGPEGGIPGRTELIPVHTVAYSMDSLLDGSATAHCPRFNMASKRMLETNYVKEYLFDNDKLLQALPEITGLSQDKINAMNTKTLVKLVAAIRDMRVCQRAHDVMQPDNITRFDDFLEEFANRVSIAKWQKTDMGNLLGGRLLRAIAHRFETVRDLELGKEEMVYRLHQECNEKGNDSDEDGGCPRRFVLYVGHDTTIFDMRAALRVPITVIPGVVPYVSHIIFEFRKTTDDKFYVQVLTGDYTRSAQPEPGPFCRGKSFCELHEFLSYVTRMVPKDVDASCGAVRDGTGEFQDAKPLKSKQRRMTDEAVHLGQPLFASYYPRSGASWAMVTITGLVGIALVVLGCAYYLRRTQRSPYRSI